MQNNKIVCECGSSYSENGKAKHLETKKHKLYEAKNKGITLETIKCEECGSNYLSDEKEKHLESKKHKLATTNKSDQVIITCICTKSFKEGEGAAHNNSTFHKNFMNKKLSNEEPKPEVEKIVEKIKCECGAEIAKSSMSSHKKTKKHLEAISAN